MNILLTGITGFIGKNLSKKLIDDGHTLYAIVRETTNIDNIDKNIKIYTFSDSYKDLYEFIVNNKINGVIHLATNFLANHVYEDIDNLIESNVTFPLKLLDIVAKTNIEWFINTGTVWQNYNNSDSYLPTNLYSATKQSFDDMLPYYNQISSCKFTTLKICDTFGKNDTRKKIMNLLQDLSVGNKPELKMSPGEQLIDILYIDDVLDGYLKLIDYINKAEKYMIKKEYLISSLELVKLKELVTEYENITNVKLSIKWGGRPYRDREVMIPWVSGNIVPAWRKKFTLQDGIKHFLQIGGNENE